MSTTNRTGPRRATLPTLWGCPRFAALRKYLAGAAVALGLAVPIYAQAPPRPVLMAPQPLELPPVSALPDVRPQPLAQPAAEPAKQPATQSPAPKSRPPIVSRGASIDPIYPYPPSGMPVGGRGVMTTPVSASSGDNPISYPEPYSSRTRTFGEFGSGWRNFISTKLLGRSTALDNPPAPTPAVDGAGTVAAPSSSQLGWRWYGYGSIRPGPNPFAPNGAYPKPSPEFFAQTGATPGAFPAPDLASDIRPHFAQNPQRPVLTVQPVQNPRPGLPFGGPPRSVNPTPPPANMPPTGALPMRPWPGGPVQSAEPPLGMAKPGGPRPLGEAMARPDLIPPPPLPAVRWQSAAGDMAGALVPELPPVAYNPAGRPVMPAVYNAAAWYQNQQQFQEVGGSPPPRPLALQARGQDPGPIRPASHLTAAHEPIAVPMPPVPYIGPPPAAPSASAPRSAQLASAPQPIARGQAPSEAQPAAALTAPTAAPPALLDQVRACCGSRASGLEVTQTAPGTLKVKLWVRDASEAEPTVNRIAALPELAKYKVDFEVSVR